MLFNSLEFAIFFPLIVCIYFFLAQRWRTLWLLTTSCVFYMAFIPAYIIILFVTILIDYCAGIYIEKTNPRGKFWLLSISILATCLVLFVFKYFAFFTGTFVGFAEWFGWKISLPTLNIILPIGLSFHTFQSLSYVIEVYRGHQKPERNFVTYATYVMFFPQLVAGPIERPQNLLPQFRERVGFDYERVSSGLKRIAWGLFKKVVVADRLALYVSDVYGSPQKYNGLQLTLATVFFAYQIYCDFSGYSDIAIGSARVLGFNLMENFKTPYYSTSVSEFWKRWHISLSTWFRDYIYIPMGGSRLGETRLLLNVFITFLISGLWHGANWSFVAWGVLNGLYLIVGRITSEYRNKLFDRVGLGQDTLTRQVIMLVTTFTLTCGAWIVFRAQNLSDAWYIFTHLLSNWDIHEIKTPHFLLRHLPVALAAIATLEVIQFCRQKRYPRFQWSSHPVYLRHAAYLAFVFTIILFGVFQTSQFIYFQF